MSNHRVVPVALLVMALAPWTAAAEEERESDALRARTEATGVFYGSFEPVRLSEPVARSRVRTAPPDLLGDLRIGRLDLDGATHRVLVAAHAPDYRIVVDADGNERFDDELVLRLRAQASESRPSPSWSTETIGPNGELLGFSIRGDRPDLLMLHRQTIRRGELPLQEGPMSFAIVGRAGAYDRPSGRIYFDLNRDGDLITTPRGDEGIAVADGLVLIDGRAYRFSIEGSGSAIELEPTDLEPPFRAVKGQPMRDVGFLDLKGNSRTLGEFRGRVLVLHSWGSWCAPCRDLTPRLVEANGRFAGGGLQLIGLNRADRLEAAIDYADDAGMVWPHAFETDDAELSTLYQFDEHGVPSILIIDRDGIIVARLGGAGPLLETIERLMRENRSDR